MQNTIIKFIDKESQTKLLNHVNLMRVRRKQLQICVIMKHWNF